MKSTKIGAAVLALSLGLGGAVVTTTAASAHTPSASATCETLTVNLTQYAGQQPAVAAEGYTEFEFVHASNENKDPRWEREGWNADSNPQSTGWTSTGNTRFVETKAASEAKTNTVVVTIDGAVVDSKDFGNSFSQSYGLGDKYVAHSWSVAIVAWDGPSNPAWSRTLTGTSTPCERPVEPPPVTPNSLALTSSVDCGTATVTLRNVSPWVYPVTFRVDGGAPFYGATVDNRTNGGVGGPQKDQSNSRTFTFEEDSGTHTIEYRIDAGTERDLYAGKPVGEWQMLTVNTDCEPNAPTFDPTCTTVTGSEFLVGDGVISVPGDWASSTIPVPFEGTLADIGTVLDIQAEPLQYVGLHIRTAEGTIVFEEEPSYNGELWSTVAWDGVEPGLGYAAFGSIEEFIELNGDTVVTGIDLLYTHPEASSTAIESFTIGCTVYTFVPELPETDVDNGDWATGEYDCDDTTVTETRTVTTTTYTRGEDGQPVASTEVTTETRERALTAEEIAELECPVVEPPADVDCSDFATQAEAQAFFDANFAEFGDFANLDADGDGVACETGATVPPVTEKPVVTPAKPAPVLPAAPVNRELAMTGPADIAGIGGLLGLLALATGAALIRGRRTAAAE